MFTGLSAFPLTPFKDEKVHFDAFERIVTRLTEANIDSIGALGSTGLYPYIEREDKSKIIKIASQIGGNIPVMAGIGALRTTDILKNAEAAQTAGAQAVLLAPMSYHPLNEQEVFQLYQTVCKELSVPLCVYDNPGVTKFTFSDDLFEQVTQLDNVAAVKIPGFPFAEGVGKERLAELRKRLPAHVAIGVSGDKFGTTGMAEGCDLWLSVLGGLFPKTVQRLIHSAQHQTLSGAQKQAEPLNELFELFVRAKGGLRVMAAAAELLGYAESGSLPSPLIPLQGKERMQLARLIEGLD